MHTKILDLGPLDMNQQDARSNQKCNYAWVVIGIASLFLVYKYILQISPSIMTHELMEAFSLQGVGLGNLAATFFYSYMITQLFVGVLLDRFSPRVLSAIAIIVAAMGAFLFASAKTFWLAAFARSLMGIGAAFATVSYMKIAAMWFRAEQFAFVAGLLATAAMLGALFGQAPLAFVVNHVGWRNSLVWCGILGVFIAALFIVFIKSDHQTEVVSSKINGKKISITFKDVMDVLKNKQNWILTFYSGLSFSPVAVFGGLWGNPFLEEAYRVSKTTAAGLVSFIFIGLAIGGPVLGFISDRCGNRRPIMLAGAFLSVCSVTLVIYCTGMPLWLVAGLLFLFGFGTGAFMLGFAIGKEINKALLAATVIALINTGDAIFGAVTEPLIGKLLDLGWQNNTLNGVRYFSVHDFHMALIILPFYLLVAFILVFFIKQKKLTLN